MKWKNSQIYGKIITPQWILRCALNSVIPNERLNCGPSTIYYSESTHSWLSNALYDNIVRPSQPKLCVDFDGAHCILSNFSLSHFLLFHLFFSFFSFLLLPLLVVLCIYSSFPSFFVWCLGVRMALAFGVKIYHSVLLTSFCKKTNALKLRISLISLLLKCQQTLSSTSIFWSSALMKFCELWIVNCE